MNFKKDYITRWVSEANMRNDKTPCRRWCFTFNNYSEQEYDILLNKLKELCEYFIVGKERKSTIHLQGFICLKLKARFSTLKNKLNPRIHFEKAKFSVQHNIRYCSKENDFVTHGTPPKYNNERVTGDDIANDFIDHMDNQTSHTEFMKTYPKHWLMNGTRYLQNYYRPKAEIMRDNIFVLYLHGPTRIGKTHLAHALLPNAYKKVPTTKWWHSYRLQTTCIEDEISFDCVSINHWLLWLDKWPISVETKGGELPLHVSTFIITSNFAPTEIFKYNTEALLARMTVVEYTSRDQYESIRTIFNTHHVPSTTPCSSYTQSEAASSSAWETLSEASRNQAESETNSTLADLLESGNDNPFGVFSS